MLMLVTAHPLGHIPHPFFKVSSIFMLPESRGIEGYLLLKMSWIQFA